MAKWTETVFEANMQIIVRYMLYVNMVIKYPAKFLMYVQNCWCGYTLYMLMVGCASKQTNIHTHTHA